MNKKIIMLAGRGESTLYMYNGLKNNFPISNVVIEEEVNTRKFVKKRIRKLGYIKVIGQIFFNLLIPKILRLISKQRIKQIQASYSLDNTAIPSTIIKNVDSVNSLDCIEFLQKEKPDLIIVNGTRIISKKVLNCIDATFINTHLGITPKYRGVHGGYWAMVNEDKENCGVTVHLVDTGIDTGEVLLQKNILTNSEDNFATYTYLQIGEGIQLMNQTISDFINNIMNKKNPQTTESHLRYHPTLWYYLYNRLIKGVK